MSDKTEPWVHMPQSQYDEMQAELRRLQTENAILSDEVERRREQIGQAFDAMDSRHQHQPKRFTKYPCHCGAMISNAGYAAQSHLRGTIHRQNMERKALGLDPV